MMSAIIYKLTSCPPKILHICRSECQRLNKSMRVTLFIIMMTWKRIITQKYCLYSSIFKVTKIVSLQITYTTYDWHASHHTLSGTIRLLHVRLHVNECEICSCQ
ncbi:hypothetical protein O6H91_09G017700 [Diphasiastrum complanatum]|uniref:Uncharacterized protein n=1 Tax=Diphasiastrum complanatum TaxID=34168 RepID=A0ACC2CLQ0_DIPCM|nr:hypothetical protein O6H91_09G017700 [Diphasiastrum complanatum]